MGSRKHIRAEKEKEAKKSLYFAKLTNNPSSPRKTRLMADLIRGVNVEKALHTLQYSSKESAIKLRKLLLSAIANWQSKNEGVRIEESNLYIKEVFVDGGRQFEKNQNCSSGQSSSHQKTLKPYYNNSG